MDIFTAAKKVFSSGRIRDETPVSSLQKETPFHFPPHPHLSDAELR